MGQAYGSASPAAQPDCPAGTATSDLRAAEGAGIEGAGTESASGRGGGAWTLRRFRRVHRTCARAGRRLTDDPSVIGRA